MGRFHDNLRHERAEDAGLYRQPVHIPCPPEAGLDISDIDAMEADAYRDARKAERIEREDAA